MHFVDEVTIFVRGGDGGDGCVAFRREAHVPRGGPSGGDGGRGGDIILIAHSGMSTLLDFRFKREYRAQRGQNGQNKDCYGKGGESMTINVPCGTLVIDADTNEVIADLVEHDQTFIAARGGRGGLGNIHFVSSTNRAPRQSLPGEPGEERRLRLELKLLADAGLVGLPNAGKSTLISRISAARPKIADYPFTTLVPALGVVGLSGERSFVVADIPGLIEGAHHGAGLGDRFLRHIERTNALIFILDDRHHLYQEPGSPLEDLDLLRHELSAFDPSLIKRACLIVINKADLLTPERRAELTTQFVSSGKQILFISGVTGEGIKELLEQIWSILHPE